MGAGQSNKITSNDKAILDLKHQRDKLKQYQKRLQINIDNHSKAARASLSTGQKSRALTALRQRKYDEQLLDKTDSQLSVLQELLSSIEFSQLQSRVVQSLSNGATVLKELQKEMTLEMVEAVMDRVGEGVEAQREIDQALMSKISPSEESECQAELAALERELTGVESEPTAEAGRQAQAQVPIKVGDIPILPSAPKGEVVDAYPEAEEEAVVKEKQKRREEDLHMAMTA